MALYNDLSASDKSVVQNTVNLIRAGSGSFAKFYNQLKAISDDTNAVNLVLSIDAGDTIPNTSGLAGADDMIRTEIVTLFNGLEAIRIANDDAAFRALASKAAGINAIAG